MLGVTKNSLIVQISMSKVNRKYRVPLYLVYSEMHSPPHTMGIPHYGHPTLAKFDEFRLTHHHHLKSTYICFTFDVVDFMGFDKYILIYPLFSIIQNRFTAPKISFCMPHLFIHPFN